LEKNPLGQVPVLEDGEFVLYESHAIACYLAKKYNQYEKYFGEDLRTQALVDQYLHSHHSTIRRNNQNLVSLNYFQRMYSPPPTMQDTQKHIQGALNAWQYIDTILSKRPFLAGEKITFADISCACERSHLIYFYPSLDLSQYSNITRWYEQVKNHFPSFQQVETVLPKIKGFCDSKINSLPKDSQDIYKLGSMKYEGESSFHIIINFEVEDKDIEEFCKIAKELETETKLENGCLFFEWGRNFVYPNVFCLTEKWGTVEAWRNHRTTPHFQNLIPKIRPMFRVINYEYSLPI